MPTTDPPTWKTSFDGPDTPKFSSAKQAGDWMDIMQQEKPHNFKVYFLLDLASVISVISNRKQISGYYIFNQTRTFIFTFLCSFDCVVLYTCRE